MTQTSTAPERDTTPTISLLGFVYGIEMAGDSSQPSNPVIGMIPELEHLEQALVELLPDGALEDVQGPDICGRFIVSLALEEKLADASSILATALESARQATCAARLQEMVAITLWTRGKDGQMAEFGDFEDDLDEAQRVAERMALTAEVRLVPCGDDWRDYPLVEPRQLAQPRRSSPLSK